MENNGSEKRNYQRMKYKRSHPWRSEKAMFVEADPPVSMLEVAEEFKNEKGCSHSNLMKRCASPSPSNSQGENWVALRKEFRRKLEAEQQAEAIDELIRTRKKHRGFAGFMIGKALHALGYPIDDQGKIDGAKAIKAIKAGLQFEKAPDAGRYLDLGIRLERLIMGEAEHATEISGQSFRCEVHIVEAADQDARRNQLDKAILAVSEDRSEEEE